jgi:hypothetical protein
MDASNLTLNGISGQSLALTQQTVGMNVMRMAIDSQAAEGAQLVKMMEQAAGLGTTINTHA